MLKNDVSWAPLLYPRFIHQSCLLSSLTVSVSRKGKRRSEKRSEASRAMAPMSDMKMMNAIRSGVVVLGALAFGYLSIQIGFKPFLEKAQQQHALHQQSDSNPSSLSQESDFPERDS